MLRLIGQTWQEAMWYLSRVVEGIGRTGNVAERFFRRYKQRVGRMGCFMSLPGCDAFHFLSSTSTWSPINSVGSKNATIATPVCVRCKSQESIRRPSAGWMP